MNDEEIKRDLIAQELAGLLRILMNEPVLELGMRNLLAEKISAWDAANAAVRKLRQLEWT